MDVDRNAESKSKISRFNFEKRVPLAVKLEATLVTFWQKNCLHYNDILILYRTVSEI